MQWSLFSFGKGKVHHDKETASLQKMAVHAFDSRNAGGRFAHQCLCGARFGNPGGYAGYSNGTPGYSLQKSRIAAGILAILVGALGIHNFYLGYNARGTVQLLVSVLTCGIGAVPMGIWALVEGIMLLCGSTSYDARGIPLKD